MFSLDIELKYKIKLQSLDSQKYITNLFNHYENSKIKILVSYTLMQTKQHIISIKIDSYIQFLAEANMIRIRIKYYGSATLMCYIEPYTVLHLFNCKRNKN